ncbi:MAG: AAA family ATPase [Acidobacteriota bacterium]
MSEAGRSYLVVTLARQMGAGGSFVGRRLAMRLGCRYLDREILLEAARRLKRDPEALECFDERHLTFWERTRMAYAFGTPESPYAPPPVTLDDMNLFDTEREIMREAAARGPVVIVGRAGFAVLKGQPGLLTVFLHAPLAHRIRRIQKIYHLASADEARDLILQSDRDRERFIRAAAGLPWLDLTQYHLSLDTGRLGTGAAIEIVYQAAMEVARGLAPPA